MKWRSTIVFAIAIGLAAQAAGQSPGGPPQVPAYEDPADDPLPPAIDSTPPLPAEPPGGRVDPELVQSAGQGGGTGTASFADRLNEGPQEVGVLVDVTGPATANLNINAKLVLTARNQGRNDAYDVVVTDVLPPNLKYVDAAPQPDQTENGVLVWRIGTLASGSERSIELTVTPIQGGGINHVPRVDFSTGAKARMTILQPRLQVEVTPSKAKLLKGDVVDFNITVQNIGDGVATGVVVQTVISKGLSYDGEKLVWSQRIDDLGPKETKGPYPFTVDATELGEQSCEVSAFSDDVKPAGAEGSVAIGKVMVEAPELDVKIAGPTDWLKGSRAVYRITVSNKGTAPAQEVAVAAFAPFTGKPEPPADAELVQDAKNSLYKIYWQFPRLDPTESRSFELPVRLDETQNFTISVAANAQGAGSRDRIEPVRDSLTTKVDGLADVEILEVDRADQVIGVGDTTEFTIRLRNEGSQDAKGVKVGIEVTDCLEVKRADGTEEEARRDEGNPSVIVFPTIDRIAQGAEKKLYVEVGGLKPGHGEFKVHVVWEGLEVNQAKEKKTFIRVNPSTSSASP